MAFAGRIGSTPAYEARRPAHAPYPQQTLAVGACVVSNVPVIPEGAVGLLMPLDATSQTTPARKMRFRNNKMKGQHSMLGVFTDHGSAADHVDRAALTHSVVPCVFPDTLALPKVLATTARGAKKDAHCDTTGVYVSGACNVRCKAGTAHSFKSNTLVYVDVDTDGHLCGADAPGLQLGNLVLGVCLEDGDRGASTVRVYVDGALNAYQDA